MIEPADRNGDEYAVYAILVARRERAERAEHFYRGHHERSEAMPIAYYVWLIAGRGRVILVDTGFTPEVGARRGDRIYVQTPVESLRMLGLEASDVDTVVITHLHYDHTGFVDAFPGARLMIQRAELDYWSGPMAQRGENPGLVEAGDLDAIRRLVAEGRAIVIDGEAEVAPGILARLVGGHTAGLQVVAVDHGSGCTVIASDASHFFDNIAQDKPYSIVDHLPSMYRAFDWMSQKIGGGGSVIPGHDPVVLEAYPGVPGLEGVVARLA
tara:strand:- start:4532 stop:5338 length:807 start_codon:yes stop_codon:yes gene_type:complete